MPTKFMDFTCRRSLALALAVSVSPIAMTGVANAQVPQADVETDVVITTGIRQSLENALIEKRQSDNLIEVIQAEDIGKLPDQNLAEVLENITGIQITRTAGIGTAVQIRGTDANRTEINGVSTVGSGSGRSGISFEDLPASLISSVEVIKVPTAKTIEGSVGGTINLRTIRPLDLDDRIISFRAQIENSDLADNTTPRFSGTIGDNWTNSSGQELGLVFSGSYARQNVAAFLPRVDRDGLVTPGQSASSEDFPFLRIQFLDQDLDNFEFETFNLNGSLEYSPNDSLKFYVDGTFNDQQRTQESTRAFFSGVSAGAVVNNTTNTAFETVDFGSLTGPNGAIAVGNVQAVLAGILEPGTNLTGNLDPNLRTVIDTGARLTESAVIRSGFDWEADRLSGTAEFGLSTSVSESPNIGGQLDFINPNSTQPSLGRSLDNGTPAEFDFTGGILQFGIAQGLSTTPTTEQLLDPANYQIRSINPSQVNSDNRELALRFDVNYDTDGILPFISSFDAGYRYNDSSAENNELRSAFNFTSSTNSFNRPNGDLFSGILRAGPDNFGDADDRNLFIDNFLVINPELAFDDPSAISSAVNSAIQANNLMNDPTVDGPDIGLISAPTSQADAFFEISEETHALYAQMNFNTDNYGIPIRGNAGLRWVSTDVTSVGNTVIGGVAQLVESESSYEFFLPRFNFVADLRDDVLLRGGVSRDIRRPNFDTVSTSASFGPNGVAPVAVGNPDLNPEAVWSFDLAGEYYFSPSSVLSVGVFHKIRRDVFTEIQQEPAANQDPDGTLNVDITAPCESGGIFNPVADINLQNPAEGLGVCVPLITTVNGEGDTTQTGIEAAFQYNLSAWEDRLGWASGFGFIGNYTYQTTGGSREDFASSFQLVGGNRNILGNLGVANPLDQIRLTNLSKNSYNATIFYEKYGLSARARYTWRSSFTADGAFRFGVPRITGSRGQLNASVTYDINENLSVGVEGINLTREDQEQFCVNNNALLCNQGLTDRRIIGGINYRF